MERAGATLALVDGRTSVADIAAALSGRFRGVRSEEIWGLLGNLGAARLVDTGSADPGRLPPAGQAVAGALGQGAEFTSRAAGRTGPGVSVPLGLLAELTHRCPLHCPYCSNPVQLTAAGDERSEEHTSELQSLRH